MRTVTSLACAMCVLLLADSATAGDISLDNVEGSVSHITGEGYYNVSIEATNVEIEFYCYNTSTGVLYSSDPTGWGAGGTFWNLTVDGLPAGTYSCVAVLTYTLNGEEEVVFSNYVDFTLY